jgi:type VI secretion system secreted protein VgrG
MPVTTNLSTSVLGNGGTIPTLTSGVYHFDSSAQLTGMLTLDAQGNNNAFWVFQVGSSLTTDPASSVVLSNPGLNNGVFWQIGESATLDSTTSFLGNIIADQSISLVTGANISCGRAIALNGAVTMDTNDISVFCEQDTTGSGFSGGLEFDQSGNIVPSQGGPGSPVVPEPATMLLFGLGGVATVFRGRRKALTC